MVKIGTIRRVMDGPVFEASVIKLDHRRKPDPQNGRCRQQHGRHFGHEGKPVFALGADDVQRKVFFLERMPDFAVVQEFARRPLPGGRKVVFAVVLPIRRGNERLETGVLPQRAGRRRILVRHAQSPDTAFEHEFKTDGTGWQGANCGQQRRYCGRVEAERAQTDRNGWNLWSGRRGYRHGFRAKRGVVRSGRNVTCSGLRSRTQCPSLGGAVRTPPKRYLTNAGVIFIRHEWVFCFS